jgi:glutamate synthase (NADPH/NADH) large chain
VELLADWPGTVARLTEVMPRDYRRVLEARAEAERDGLDADAVDKRIMEVLHG